MTQSKTSPRQVPSDAPSTPVRTAGVVTRWTLPLVGVLLLGGTALYAWSRTGMFDLPHVPATVTLSSAGLDRLEALGQVDLAVRSAAAPAAGDLPPRPTREETAASGPGDGVSIVASIGEEARLESLRAQVQQKPDNLALGNAYRMAVFRLRRQALAESRERGDVTPAFPPHLSRQPVAFFEELVGRHPSRETKLQLALSWVDEMLLFPALEVKAPASVEAVKILTEVIDHGDGYYVPALFARGLNHLHRPSRLVWPETTKTPIDAAVRDVGLCMAIGRKLGVGSPRLRATLAMTLGDAHVKAGRQGVARSWWQVAQNLCHDDDIQEAIRRRYAWRDEEILDRLEEELDRARQAVDRPMTDLALMWN